MPCLVGPIVLRDRRKCRPREPIARSRAVHEAELYLSTPRLGLVSLGLDAC